MTAKAFIPGMALAISILLLNISPGIHAQQRLDTLNYVTEEFPPYNFSHLQRNRGIAVDTLLTASELVGTPIDRDSIRVLPWARALWEAKNKPNTVIFAIAKTDERSPDFKWVGPILTINIVAIAKKSRALTVDEQHPLTQYRVGVIRDDIGHQLIQQLSPMEGRLEILTNAHALARMLERDRIDLWIYNDAAAWWFMKNAEVDPAQFTPIFELYSSRAYIALSRDISDSLVSQLQRAVDRVKTEPVDRNKTRFDLILESYR